MRTLRSRLKRYIYTSVPVILLAAPGLAQIPDFTPPTPLFRAVLRNDTAEVKNLLARGSDPNEKRFVGFPAIFFPVMNQNVDMLHAMIDRGANIRETDASGST